MRKVITLSLAGAGLSIAVCTLESFAQEGARPPGIFKPESQIPDLGITLSIWCS